MEYILETNSIVKTFRKHNAVDNVSIHVKQGDIYGLIGRNGAGKTTLLKIISDLSAPTSGDYKLFGKTKKEMKSISSRMGTLIETPGFYANMTAEENLMIKCIALGHRDKNTAKELLELVGLSQTGKKKVGKFSLGMKQRLGMALSLVGNPDIVILDEPINGLDPNGIIEVRDMILKLNKERGITFIISSHILEELSKIATNYGIIENGKLIEEMTSEELMAKCDKRIELLTTDASRASTVLDELGIKNYKILNDGVINIYEQLERCGDITVALGKRDIGTLRIGVQNKSLEEYFVELIGENGGNKNA